MIHIATQKQIKTKYHADSKINSLMKEMVQNFVEIEKIFTELGYKIQDNPDSTGMVSGFSWKLIFTGSENTFIFDVLYSDRRFSIYITRQSLIPEGEEQHYSNPNIPCFHAKSFPDWLTLDKLEEFLGDIRRIFMR